MNSSSNASTTQYSVTTLEDTPRRALELLRGIGGSPAILALMSQAGYTARDHEEGQRLLANVVSFVEERQAFRSVTSATHTDAMNELATWERTAFRRLRATVTRFFPERVDSLFANLVISDEMDASLLAQVFLDRIDALEPEGKSGRGGGAAMRKVLAERGFGPKEIRHLRKQIETAQAPAPEAPEAGTLETATKRQARLALLAELRAWYDDWAETARTVLVRRDHAIRVGIAHRKPRATPAPPPVVAPVTTPVTPAAPPVEMSGGNTKAA